MGCTHTPTPSQFTGDNQTPQSADENKTDAKYTVTTFATGLEVPRGIAVIDDDTLYVTQRKGSIIKIKNGRTDVYFEVPDVWAKEEAWLMGIALHPEYPEIPFVYVSVARNSHLQIVRYTDSGQTLESETIVFDMLPIAQYHAWGAIAFGPDQKLYFSVGDATQKAKAQDLKSYHGKILRINPDGTLPTDNPFSDSAIYSYGHRNIQGLAWTETGDLLASEHGPSGFDGPWGGDELNRIQAGWNYGRPVVSHDKKREGMNNPLITYTPALAPSGLMVYSYNLFPQRQGKVLMAGLKGEKIVVLDANEGTQYEVLLQKDYGRLRALAQNSRGEIYISTSNRDGRGKAQENDDKILKIVLQ